MEIELDLFQLLMPLNYGFFGLIFLSIFVFRKDVRYSVWFSIAYLSASIASFIELFHQHINFGLLQFDDISNGLFFLISVAFVIGIAKSENAKIPKIYLSSVLIIGYLTQAYFAYIYQNLFLRILVCDIIAGILLIPILSILWTVRDKLINKMLFWSVIAVISNYFIRPIIGIFILDPNITLESYASEPYIIIFYFTASIIAMMMSMPLLAKLVFDILENYRQESIMDPLTGLLNRRGIKKIFYKNKNNQSKEGKCNFIVQLDLDNFKQVNDNYGHNVGDLILQRTANLIKSIVEGHGVTARIGGEEFVIFLEKQTKETILLFAESLRQSLELQNHPEIRQGQKSTASFGVAAVDPLDSLEKALDNADKALYIAKNDGRNCVKLFDKNTSMLQAA